MRVVLDQYVENCASLWNTRRVLARAGHVKLHHLERIDERIEANFAGLADARETGLRLAIASLDAPTAGGVFVAALSSLASDDPSSFMRLLALVEAAPDTEAGLTSALGWVSADSLEGVVVRLLRSGHVFHRRVGIACCSVRRVDAGSLLDRTMDVEHPDLRERALRSHGELGELSRLPSCLEALDVEHAGCRFHAACTAVLLGDRDRSLATLRSFVGGPDRARALAAARLLLMVGSLAGGEALDIRSIVAGFDDVPTRVKLIGLTGNPSYVAWLIDRMSDPRLSRAAGEAFSAITGVDLAALDLDKKPPEAVDADPLDDPDAGVPRDDDDGLPWADAEKVGAWWDAHRSRFPSGPSYFMGQPATGAHCLTVLRTGYQRQRLAAAWLSSLLAPGTPLMNIAAPAWRQRRLLRQMS